MAAASLDDWFAGNNLFIRYATSLDHCDVEAVVACFEPDGTIESPVLGRFAGAAGIRAFAQRTVRMKQEQGAQFRHVVSNLRVDVDGERASARCYLLDFVTHGGKTDLLSPGEYECALKRTAGTWRFADRRVVMDRAFALPGDPAQAVHEAERALYRAQVAGSVDAIAPLLGADLVYIHSTGVAETREQYLDGLRDRLYEYGEIASRDTRVQVTGDVAVMNGVVGMTVSAHGAAKVLIQLLFCLVWKRVDGAWLLHFRQATRIPDSAA